MPPKILGDGNRIHYDLKPLVHPDPKIDVDTATSGVKQVAEAVMNRDAKPYSYVSVLTLGI